MTTYDTSSVWSFTEARTMVERYAGYRSVGLLLREYGPDKKDVMILVGDLVNKLSDDDKLTLIESLTNTPKTGLVGIMTDEPTADAPAENED